MKTKAIIATLLLTFPLTACGLDALEHKKSDFQIEQERRSAFAMPPAATAVDPTAPAAEAAPPTVPDTPAPAIEETTQAAPEPAAPAVCQAIFRILSCGDNGEFIYL